MNKRYIYLIPALLSILFACERKDDATSTDLSGKDKSDVVFYATYENADPDTRTILQSDGSILWDAHEEISILLGDKSSRFVSSNTEPAATVEFHGSLNGFQYTSSDYFWAVYPYSQFNKCEGDNVSVYVPTLQTAKDGTFEREYFVSVARRQDFNLYFYNVCGGIKFVVNTPGIDKVTIHARGGEAPTGRVTVGFEKNVPVIKSIEATEADMEVFAPDGKTFTPGVAYYAVVIPQTYSQGFDFIFHSKGKKATTWINKKLTVKRGIFGTVTDIDKGLYFKDVPSTGNISFADAKLKAALVTAYDTNGDGELSYTEADAVTSISASVFGSDKSYTSFDEFQYFTSVRSIPAQCFKDWVWMTSIKLPESVNTIEREAFRGCTRLKNVTFGNLLEWINYAAFRDCVALQDLVIPDSVKNIYINSNWSVNTSYSGNNLGAFQNCTSLKTVKLGQGLVEIAPLTFRGCTSLESVTIGDAVESVGDYAFEGCTSLKSIHFGSSVKDIKKQAFHQCTGLTDLVITAPIENIYEQAFYGCTWLATLKFSDTVKTIGYEAFRYCSHLKSVSFGNGLEWINYAAFRDCVALQDLVIPDSVKNIYINSNWSVNTSYSGNNLGAFQNCTSLKTVKLGQGLVEIAPLTFRGCTSLESVTIGDAVETVGDYAFDGCKSLQNIHFGSSVKSLSKCAFSNCSVLTVMTFPDPIQTIGESAFANCTALTGITLGSSVTSVRSNAFKGCTSLTRLELGETLEEIYPGAFQNCTSLSYVKIPDSVKLIYGSNSADQGAFQGCTYLNKVVLGNRVEGIPSYTFSDCSNLTNITVGESVEYVSKYAFRNCKSLAAISFENANLKTVGDYAFYYCTSLDSVIFGDKLTSLGSYVFDHSGIRYLTLPATIQSMGSYIFRYCSDFSRLTMLAEFPPSIGSNVFSYTNDSFTIVVPHDSLLRYREAWSSYSSHIIASN